MEFEMTWFDSDYSLFVLQIGSTETLLAVMLSSDGDISHRPQQPADPQKDVSKTSEFIGFFRVYNIPKYKSSETNLRLWVPNPRFSDQLKDLKSGKIGF